MKSFLVFTSYRINNTEYKPHKILVISCILYMFVTILNFLYILYISGIISPIPKLSNT